MLKKIGKTLGSKKEIAKVSVQVLSIQFSRTGILPPRSLLSVVYSNKGKSVSTAMKPVLETGSTAFVTIDETFDFQATMFKDSQGNAAEKLRQLTIQQRHKKRENFLVTFGYVNFELHSISEATPSRLSLRIRRDDQPIDATLEVVITVNTYGEDYIADDMSSVMSDSSCMSAKDRYCDAPIADEVRTASSAEIGNDAIPAIIDRKKEFFKLVASSQQNKTSNSTRRDSREGPGVSTLRSPFDLLGIRDGPDLDVMALEARLNSVRLDLIGVSEKLIQAEIDRDQAKADFTALQISSEKVQRSLNGKVSSMKAERDALLCELSVLRSLNEEANDTLESTQATLTAELDDLKAKNNELSARLQSTRASGDSGRASLKASNAELSENLRSVTAEKEALGAELSTLKGSSADMAALAKAEEARAGLAAELAKVSAANREWAARVRDLEVDVKDKKRIREEREAYKRKSAELMASNTRLTEKLESSQEEIESLRANLQELEWRNSSLSASKGELADDERMKNKVLKQCLLRYVKKLSEVERNALFEVGVVLPSSAAAVK